MLQVKGLVKRYVAKGETVTALDGVSVVFPERGMVFLLGRSGSGKSTLLNVAGGLDEADEGEVIVKGRSSKSFSKSDFDSYRNTYVGFIFQEYNVLNELTVAENIALALELQGKPRDEERVRELLREVDLEGMGDRRPNTLSGGQKQRVAIARALVKNPEIIMADEPTGALDSATGKQVFDTLKKLSAEKLVVVVSHDREFAEQYADRIIELKDGKIVSDVTGAESGGEESNLVVSEEGVTVACGAALTEEEAERVLSYIRGRKGSVVLSAGTEQRKTKRKFAPTASAPTPREEAEGGFIRSRFPMRYALKMGVSGLKFKPVRLALTTLLATVAFIVFGVFSTLLTYSPVEAGTDALNGSAFTAGVLCKKGVAHCVGEDGAYTRNFPIVSYLTLHFDEEDVARLSAELPGLDLLPVIDFNVSPLSFSTLSLQDGAYSAYYDRIRFFTGFTQASRVEEKFPLVYGRWPQPVQGAVSEVVLSLTAFECYRHYGYCENTESEPVKIERFEDLEGQLITANVDTQRKIYLQVVGVADTGERFPDYAYLHDEDDPSEEEEEAWREVYRYSCASLGYVADTFYEENESFDLSATFYEGEMLSLRRDRSVTGTAYRESTDGALYSYLFTSLGEDRGGRSAALMQYHAFVDEERDIYYFTPYSFMSEIAEGNRILAQLLPIVGSAAGVLALFSALLLFNFISASINAKKKDIGILRAVGARGVDVFKIFIVESAVITLFCFTLGCLGSLAACAVANGVVTARGLLSFPLFLFGWKNALIVFGIAACTALIATAVPVTLAARKRPVEAIRTV